MLDRSVREQVGAVVAVVRRALHPAEMIGAYLYGSAADGGLRPDSDLDVFIVTDRRLEAPEKARIVEGLLPISGHQTRPPAWRPVEVTIVAQPEVHPWRYPPRMELQYGEWLRTTFLNGEVEPDPAENPDLGVLIAMVRHRGRALFGPPPGEVLDSVPHADLVQAMVDALPPLLDDLDGDTRNVLLTLARIWTTVATGKIRPKDVAANWALGRLPETHRPLLARARKLYRSGGYGVWPDSDAVHRLADHLVREILAAAEAGRGPAARRLPG